MPTVTAGAHDLLINLNAEMILSLLSSSFHSIFKSDYIYKDQLKTYIITYLLNCRFKEGYKYISSFLAQYYNKGNNCFKRAIKEDELIKFINDNDIIKYITPSDDLIESLLLHGYDLPNEMIYKIIKEFDSQNLEYYLRRIDDVNSLKNVFIIYKNYVHASDVIFDHYKYILLRVGELIEQDELIRERPCNSSLEYYDPIGIIKYLCEKYVLDNFAYRRSMIIDDIYDYFNRNFHSIYKISDFIIELINNTKNLYHGHDVDNYILVLILKLKNFITDDQWVKNNVNIYYENMFKPLEEFLKDTTQNKDKFKHIIKELMYFFNIIRDLSKDDSKKEIIFRIYDLLNKYNTNYNYYDIFFDEVDTMVRMNKYDEDILEDIFTKLILNKADVFFLYNRFFMQFHL